MNITFPAGKHGFNGTRMCVSFQAIVDGSTKLVFISTEALQDVYKLSPGGEAAAVDCYENNSHQIQQVAEKLIRATNNQDVSEFLITSKIARVG